MINLKLKRLWNNLVSIRDYEVKKYIKEGKTVTVTVEGQDGFMILEPKDLVKGFNAVKKEFNSKYYRGQKYSLIDFQWKPNEEKQEKLI